MLPLVCRAVSGGSIVFGYVIINGFGWEKIEEFPFNVIGTILIMLGASLFTCIGIFVGRKRNKEEYKTYTETIKKKQKAD